MNEPIQYFSRYLVRKPMANYREFDDLANFNGNSGEFVVPPYPLPLLLFLLSLSLSLSQGNEPIRKAYVPNIVFFCVCLCHFNKTETQVMYRSAYLCLWGLPP